MAQTELFAVVFLLSVLSACVTATDNFSVEGRVYCDTCRAGFETNVTEYVSGARVKVECTHFVTNIVEHTDEGVTDASGSYKIAVRDDHEDEICEVVLVDSPLDDCKEVKGGRDRARVVLTTDGGITGSVRQANSLGFLRDEPLPICGKLLQEYGLGDEQYY
ncbi:Pollen-specific protein C13 [Apostasia shenzhenica]|uniref:Pollen-specific protein C13 n=1 Tax=Apostasia shenzhenica TaxID=1088818 RepID=A0A2I0BGM9_9ASPA|nr:Pollen-specific protein C13 [Apostasia shenzhenica]